MFSQRQIRNFIFETVSQAQNNIRPHEVCYVVETQTWYKAYSTPQAADNKNVIASNYPLDSDLKWVRLKSPFEPWRDPVKSYAYSDPANISHPADGDRYLVKPTGVGDWESADNQIATYIDGKWIFTQPSPGDMIISLDTWTVYKYVEDPDNAGQYIWLNILADFANVIDVSYDTLVNLINESKLKPGTYYRITDYHTENWIDSDHSNRHISENEEIFVLALTPSVIASSAFSQKNPQDIISYNTISEVKVYGEVSQSKMGEGWGETHSNLNRYTYSDATDSVDVSASFVDDSNLTIQNLNISLARIRVGSDTTWRKLDGSEGVSYDGTTITLTDSSLSFRKSTGFSEIRIAEFINVGVYDDEYPKGKIYYRNDTSKHVEADFDFRNFKIQKFSGSPTKGVSETNYYMASSDDQLLWVDIDNTSEGYTSSETSALLEPIIGCSNTRVFNTRYTTVQNVISGDILQVYNSAIYSGENIRIQDCYYIIFNAYSKLKNISLYSTKFIFTSNQAFNGMSIVPVTLKNVEINTVFSKLFFITTNISDTVFYGTGNNIFPEEVSISNSKINFENVKFTYSRRVSITNSQCKINDVKFTTNNISIDNSVININGNNDSEIQRNITNSNINLETFSNSKLSGNIDKSDITITATDSTLLGVIDSAVKGSLSSFIFDRDITKSSIVVNDNFTLPSITLRVLCDTSSNSISLELPPDPSEGIEYTIVDTAANAANNSITINTSSSPNTGVVNTINGNSSRVININYGILKLVYDETAGWIVIDETTIQLYKDDITIDIINNDQLTIKNIDHIIDDDNQSIDGSNTPSTDSHKELVTKAYVQTYDLTKKPVRLLANTQSITPNGNQNIDGVDVADGDRVALFGNGDGTEGFYIVNTAGDWERTDDLPVGYNASGVQFAVLEGDTKSNTVWQISDPPGSDVVGTNDLHLIELASMHNIQWIKDNSPTGFGQELYPADSHVKRIEIKNNERGFNEIYLENNNSSDNYTGASITLTVDSANYTNQTFIAHHGSNYYLPQLRSRGAIMTDSSMYIGAYNTTDQQGQPSFVAFVVGDDYHNQKEIFRLTTRGLEMPLADKKIWYEAAKTTQNHPSEYTQLFCNVATSEIYAGIPMVLGPVRVVSTPNITLNNTQTIDGVALNDGDRVLVAGQSDAKENGIYIAKENADWVRAGDLPDGSTCAGKTVVVQEGTQYADSLWEFSSDTGSDVIGTNEIYLKLLSGGVATPITDVFNITASDVANGYVTLTHTIDTTQHDFVFLNGLLLEPTIEYTISGNQVNFTAEANIEAGDKVIVKYYI